MPKGVSHEQLEQDFKKELGVLLKKYKAQISIEQCTMELEVDLITKNENDDGISEGIVFFLSNNLTSNDLK